MNIHNNYESQLYIEAIKSYNGGLQEIYSAHSCISKCNVVRARATYYAHDQHSVVHFSKFPSDGDIFRSQRFDNVLILDIFSMKNPPKYLQRKYLYQVVEDKSEVLHPRERDLFCTVEENGKVFLQRMGDDILTFHEENKTATYYLRDDDVALHFPKVPKLGDEFLYRRTDNVVILDPSPTESSLEHDNWHVRDDNRYKVYEVKGEMILMKIDDNKIPLAESYSLGVVSHNLNSNYTYYLHHKGMACHFTTLPTHGEIFRSQLRKNIMILDCLHGENSQKLQNFKPYGSPWDMDLYLVQQRDDGFELLKVTHSRVSITHEDGFELLKVTHSTVSITHEGHIRQYGETNHSLNLHNRPKTSDNDNHQLSANQRPSPDLNVGRVVIHQAWNRPQRRLQKWISKYKPHQRSNLDEPLINAIQTCCSGGFGEIYSAHSFSGISRKERERVTCYAHDQKSVIHFSTAPRDGDIFCCQRFDNVLILDIVSTKDPPEHPPRRKNLFQVAEDKSEVLHPRERDLFRIVEENGKVFLQRMGDDILTFHEENKTATYYLRDKDVALHFPKVPRLGDKFLYQRNENVVILDTSPTESSHEHDNWHERVDNRYEVMEIEGQMKLMKIGNEKIPSAISYSLGVVSHNVNSTYTYYLHHKSMACYFTTLPTHGDIFHSQLRKNIMTLDLWRGNYSQKLQNLNSYGSPWDTDLYLVQQRDDGFELLKVTHKTIRITHEDLIQQRLKNRRSFAAKTNPDGKDDVCAVCLDAYKDFDRIGIIQCGHEYHVSCIIPWLRRKSSCPLCRTPDSSMVDIKSNCQRLRLDEF